MTPNDAPRSTGEPILINGISVSVAVGATLALLARFGVPILEGDATLVTAFVSLVVIPLGTWILARRKTVTVDAANEAIQTANALPPSVPAPTFEKGS